jgi:hypothetical protein
MSFLYVCSDSGPVVEIEYISMMLASKGSITPNQTYCRTLGASDPICTIKTQQEFLFEIYLRNHFPDLLLMFTTFAHLRHKTFQQVELVLNHLIGVIDKVALDKTKVVWFINMWMHGG